MGKYVNLPGTWAPVLAYEDYYSISDDGLVWGNRYGRLLKPYWNGGHWQVKLSNGVGRPSARYVHVLMLESFVSPLPSPKHRGLHRDDDPHRNVLSNLYWGTMQTNAFDRVRNGRDVNARKTECDRGHLLSGPNLAPWSKPNQRHCLACNRANTLGRYRGYSKDSSEMKVLYDEKYSLIMVGL